MLMLAPLIKLKLNDHTRHENKNIPNRYRFRHVYLISTIELGADLELTGTKLSDLTTTNLRREYRDSDYFTSNKQLQP